MIRGAGPGRYLGLTDGAGAVPVVRWKKLAALPRHTCGGGTSSCPRPAVLQSSPVRETGGVSRVGVRRGTGARGWRPRQTGQRGEG